MRAGKLEMGEFGLLGCVLAHKVAGVEAGAAFGNKDGQPEACTAGIVTWPGSGISEGRAVSWSAGGVLAAERMLARLRARMG